MPKRFVAWLLAGSVMAIMAVVVSAAGRQPRSNQDVLDALLVEVRGLRAAMEQMSSVGPRVQLAMGRLQLQEQRIVTMGRRLDALRDQRMAAERESQGLRQELSLIEEQAGRENDPVKKGMITARLDDLRRIVDQRAAHGARLAAEETEVANVIATEQSRWSDINRTLEDLERALARR